MTFLLPPFSRFAQRESSMCGDNYSKYLVTLNTLNLNGSQIAYIYAILPPCQCKSNVIQRVLKYFSCKLFIYRKSFSKIFLEHLIVLGN